MEEQNPIPGKVNKIPKWLTTVTPFSKYLAMFLFIILPFVGFYLGMRYQEVVNTNKLNISNIKIESNQMPTPPQANATNAALKENVIIPNEFPVYPGSIFVKKEVSPACIPNQTDGFTTCNSVIYTWTSIDDYIKIKNWYEQNHLGWSCAGGAGSYFSPREASGVTTCGNKQKIQYQLFVESKPSISTITLEVPTSPKPSY